jgi:hypothetical protein
MDCKRMHPTREFGRERLIDHAMTLETGLPFERSRHNMDSKMRLSARPMAGMASVLVGFVDHTQVVWPESLAQLVRNDVGDAHPL